MLFREQVKNSGIIGVATVALAVWILSLGVFKGTPQQHLNEYRDFRALVPWLFHQVGYDVFFDFREQIISKLPDDYWLKESESDRMNAIRGAYLKKADLRYADVYQAFVAKANLRNSDLRGARLRESNFQNADLRGANLKGADMRQGNFQRADFREATLAEVNLGDADLRGAQLGLVDFKGADFSDAKLTGADLRCADLRGVEHLSVEVLKTVKTLYHTKMDEDIRLALEGTHKKLMTEAPKPWFDMTTPYNVDKKDICQ